MGALKLAAAGIATSTLALACGSERVVHGHGVLMVVPQGWETIRAANDAPVSDPETLLVIGTARVRPKASRCHIAAYHLPPAGAVVVVIGWKRRALSGAQGQKQGRWPLEQLALRRPTFECFSGRGAVASLVLGGRAYQVNVLVGDRASQERVGEALAAARSFDLNR